MDQALTLRMENCNLEEELEKRSRLVVSYANEIDYKNGKLWEMERKLEEKDKLLQDYIGGRGEMQGLREENKKLKYELESRSIKEANGMRKYELQLRSITGENEKLSYELESNKREFVRRAKLQENFFIEMEKLKYKIESDTNEFELRLKGLEEQEKVIAKEKLERMENRANNAEKESMLLKKQLEKRSSKLNECLRQKNDLEKKLSSFRTENNILVKQLREELRDYEYELEEARKLKSSCGENIELLTKKLLEEKGHRARAESELLKLSEIQLWTKRLEDELSSWKMVIKEIPGVSCADDILLKFAALQREVAESTVKSGEANVLEQMEEQLEELNRRLNECLHQKNDLERKFSSFRTDNNILVKQLREELRDYESELQEARKWKLSHENIELLKENLFEEKAHRERAELELLKLSEIQLSAKKLEDELFSWKMMIEKIFPGVSCAEDIPLKFAAHQKREVAESMVKAGEADAHLKQMEVIAEAAILNTIAGTEMVEVPILEIKGDELMVLEERENVG